MLELRPATRAELDAARDADLSGVYLWHKDIAEVESHPLILAERRHKPRSNDDPAVYAYDVRPRIVQWWSRRPDGYRNAFGAAFVVVNDPRSVPGPGTTGDQE